MTTETMNTLKNQLLKKQLVNPTAANLAKLDKLYQKQDEAVEYRNFEEAMNLQHQIDLLIRDAHEETN